MPGAPGGPGAVGGPAGPSPEPGELAAAVVRATAGQAEVRIRGGRWFRGRDLLPVRAPSLFPLAGDDRGTLRGAADGVALRLTRSDGALHGSMVPPDPRARLIFELLEQFRVESLAPPAMPGVSRNLRRRHEQWSLALHHGGLTETASGLFLYTVMQVCRSRILAQAVVGETEDLIEATRAAVAADLGPGLLALRRHRTDQAAFARHARTLAEKVAAMLPAPGKGPARGDAGPDPGDLLTLLAGPQVAPSPGGPDPGVAAGRPVPSRSGGYQVFTAAYDEERHIASLARRAELTGYREHLDGLVGRQGISMTRLARELMAALAAPAPRGWAGGLEEGHIDGRRLARLIASPAERAVFRRERDEPVADALVTFLIDCSGSMTRHRERLAVLADVFARGLDTCGAECEILGFTTRAWHGGRALREWQRAGRPRHPGRLNERRHLIFKDAATPWRRARRDIAGLLKADVFREGIDGEAVAWAAARARSREARRRLLVVVSDGSPMDRATALGNGDEYLDEHLADVVAEIESRPGLEIYGLGVGLDLGPYYRRRRGLDGLDVLDDRVFAGIAGMFAWGGRDRR
ncbi:MAG TPA: hypothetical protein VKV33_12545 [Streptosporangiaceae bacterium]|nr:hypothetical protein [Streptosporangiaceae bacterium]